tara:strand:+ start:70 stop:318 length:249 start_codon:yes stop_codon:yes gene_type:complete
MTMAYNGWTNRQTWVVNLWMTNDDYSQEIIDQGRPWSPDAIEALVDDMVAEVMPDTSSMVSDLFTLDIDYRELADRWNDVEA